jgi:hypothetical protein
VVAQRGVSATDVMLAIATLKHAAIMRVCMPSMAYTGVNSMLT